MIYFDNAATTIPSENILSEYCRIERDFFANSTSIHKQGLYASRILDNARDILKKSLNVDSSHQCVFLSGATEANNLAIKGYAFRFKNRGTHLITTAVEHPSVLETFYQLRDQFGFEITILPVLDNGTVDIEALKQSMRKDTILVSIMAVNNETGAINDVKKIISVVEQFPKCRLHIDATQAIGKINLPYSKIDMFSLSAHKFGGLKGSGALIIKNSIQLMPILTGGSQENGLRSGTVDVPSCYACALAVKSCLDNFEVNYQKASEISIFLFDTFAKDVRVELNSTPLGSPYIFNFSLKEKKASVVVEALSNEDIMISSLSACHSKKEQSSYVVKAQGRDEHLSANTIRLSFWNYNTIDEAKEFVIKFNRIMESIR